MLWKSRLTPSPSMIVALLALVVGLSGGAYAATKAATNSVTSGSIQDGQVRSVDINTNAVSKLKIAGNSVDSPRVLDGSLEVADLSSAAQTALKGATGPTGAPGPSDAFAMRRLSFNNIPSPGFATLGSVAVPAGSFAIFGKATLDNDDAAPASTRCELRESASATPLDIATLTLGASAAATDSRIFTLQTTATLTGPGTFLLVCAPPAGNATVDVANVSLTVIKVGALVSSTL